MAPYLTAPEVKARAPRLVEFADADIDQAVTSFARIAESFRGVAYTPRTETEEYLLVGCRRTDLMLVHRRIRSASVDVDGQDPAGWVLMKHAGVLYRSAGWPTGVEITVTYEHGYDEPPPVLLDATVEYLSAVLTAKTSGTSRDVIAQSYDGSWTRFSTPDWEAGRPTGWTEPDRLLRSLTDERVPVA